MCYKIKFNLKKISLIYCLIVIVNSLIDSKSEILTSFVFFFGGCTIGGVGSIGFTFSFDLKQQSKHILVRNF